MSEQLSRATTALPPPDHDPASSRRPSRRALTTLAVAIALIVLLGIIGYGIAGFAFASARISTADRSLKTVISHQNSLNSTFREFDTKLGGLGTSPDPAQARMLVDQFVASATAAVSSVTQDDSSLVKASARLNDKQWLTWPDRGSLNREAARIVHARKALAAARTVAAGYGLDGLFLRAYLDATADVVAVGKLYGGGDLAGAQAAQTLMTTHVEQALQLSTAPGLPAELHDAAVDLQVLAMDIGKLLAADAAGNSSLRAAYQAKVAKDVANFNSHSFDRVGVEIDAFYKPLIDTYNSEMAAATA